MKFATSFTSISPIVFLFLVSSPTTTLSAHDHQNFLQCLSHHSSNIDTNDPEFIYTPEKDSSSFFKVLNFSIRNPRFGSPSTPKPLAIITPFNVSQVSNTVTCARKHGVQIRARSGGHDYEGLSYASDAPFVVLDLINLRSIHVDVESRSAWVGAGATVGEVYYRIAEKTLTLGFPASVCHTVGVGGHFSGGGYGTLMRKYGLSADNVIDAHVVDVHGNILDRNSMGEDLFWAIRGGGGASFGVVVAWKVRLVPVPSRVTGFSVDKVLDENAKKLVHRWQYVADKLHEDLFIRLIFRIENSADEAPAKIIKVSFNSLFLGGVDRLLSLMGEEFPELGLRREDCGEMSWIDSAMSLDGLGGQPREVLLDRVPQSILSFKAKSDYVTSPISENGLEGIWERLYSQEVGKAFLLMTPYGGKMAEIPESEIPFPHRAGNIYKIQYLVYWEEKGNITEAQTHISWIRELYSYMTPFVSKNPRSAYVNYRDLDIGANSDAGTTSYEQASIWGKKYFKGNFDRLVHVKTMVDPTNFFRNEQSIPSLSSC